MKKKSTIKVLALAIALSVITVPASSILATSIPSTELDSQVILTMESDVNPNSELPSITSPESEPDLPEEDFTPSVPSIHTFTSTDEGLLIQWSPSEGADGYRIYRKNDKGQFKKLRDLEECSTIDTRKKTNGQNYAYRIRAFVRVDGGVVWSPYSEVAEVTFLTNPSIHDLERTAKKTITKWDANEFCDGYEIQTAQKKSFKGAKTYTIKNPKTAKKTFTKGKADRTYYIRVRSYHKNGDCTTYSNWSNMVSTNAWNSKWEFAGNSKIHTGYTAWYQSPVKASKRKNLTVCVNAGHGTKGGGSVKTLSHPDGSGKVTGGTNGKGEIYSIAVSSGMDMADGTPEAKVTLALAMVVKEELLSAGYDVLMIRESEDVQLDNIARTVMANTYADCHIALHYNDTATNAGAFYCAVPNVKSYRSMYPVSKHYKDHNRLGDSLIQGLKKGGWKVKGSNMELDLTQTSYSTIPSIDLEVGDKKTDYSKTSLTKLAKGIVKGVNYFFN